MMNYKRLGHGHYMDNQEREFKQALAESQEREQARGCNGKRMPLSSPLNQICCLIPTHPSFFIRAMGAQVDFKIIVKRGPGDVARGEGKQVVDKRVAMHAVVG